MTKPWSSIPYNFTPIPMTAVLLATPDEQAVILAIHILAQLFGKGPKPMEMILGALEALPQIYNRDPKKPRTLQAMSQTQGKRAIASLRARGWLISYRTEAGGLGGYDLRIPDMEFEDAKDLVASRLSPLLVAKLGGDIKTRVDRMAGKKPAYQARPQPQGDPEQGDLDLGAGEEDGKDQEQAIADQTTKLAGIWKELFEKRYPGEKVLEAKGAVWGYFKGFADEGVTAELFTAKVVAYLEQADNFIIKERHGLFLLRIRWSQLSVGSLVDDTDDGREKPF